ncbi:hypothetical protein Tco_1186700, partial [Tanacetum coccineum]
DSDYILDETNTLLPHHDSTSPEVDDDIFDLEGDILFLENLLKDEPLEKNKSEINPLIREPSNTFLMGDNEIELNSHEDIDDLVPIPRISEKPLDSLDSISKTFDMTITDPLFDFDSEFTLNSDNPIFGIHNEESDESEMETIMDEVLWIENKSKMGIFGYVVPTGRVVVPTGRYVVPAGKVIIIVSPGRLSLVPTGRVLSPGRVK